jgi:DNA polymerase-4
VTIESEPVSISRETTFERDLHASHDKAELGRIFTHLCDKMQQDLQRKGYVGKTVGIKIKYDNFQTITRDVTLDDYVQEASTIRLQAAQCLKRVDLSRKFRLLGVRVGSLMKYNDWVQMSEKTSALIQGQTQPLF